MEVIASNKGGLKVMFEGHMYTKVFEGKTSILWSVFGVLMGAREQLKQISTRPNHAQLTHTTTKWTLLVRRSQKLFQLISTLILRKAVHSLAMVYKTAK